MKAKPRILIVEDEKPLCLLYREELEKEGYEVTTVLDAASALQALEKTPFDLVVTDIRLPGANGLDFIKKVMEFRKDVPVIINSAYESYKQDFASWAADDYVIKSGSLDELKKKIRILLEKRHVAA
ncbi:MAG: response regulator [Candidatus Aminicenantes bacterium]|nr:response regulator [Candidatus Aminicenantes bacterium]